MSHSPSSPDLGAALLPIGTLLVVLLGALPFVPLTDSTILAAVSAQADVYAHIRHMLYTAGPSFVVSLVVSLVVFATLGRCDALAVSAAVSGVQWPVLAARGAELDTLGAPSQQLVVRGGLNSMATTLGVPTVASAPWTVFCYLGPVVSLAVAGFNGVTGMEIARVPSVDHLAVAGN